MSFPSIAPQELYVDWRLDVYKLLSQKERNSEFYWILDPCAHPELPGILWKLKTDPGARPLYMNTYLEEVAAAGPLILSAQKNFAATKWILDEGRERPLGCLIEIAGGSYAKAFEHLQRQTECYPGNDKLTIFRWYDPRILYGINSYPKLDKILAKLMGPVLYFRGWEPGRCCGVILGAGQSSGYCGNEPEHYEEEFFEHIFNEAMIHTIIGTLGHIPGKRLREMPLPDAYALGEATANKIYMAGYQDKRSLAYAIALTARLGPYIWEEQNVQKALSERPKAAPISEVLAEIGL